VADTGAHDEKLLEQEPRKWINHGSISPCQQRIIQWEAGFFWEHRNAKSAPVLEEPREMVGRSDHGGSRRKRMARFFPKCQRRLVNRSVASGAVVGSIAGKGVLPNKNDRRQPFKSFFMLITGLITSIRK
jgi:hypothetical protein